MALNLGADPLPSSPTIRTIYAAAYVTEVADEDGHLASAYYEFGTVARVRLDVALRGHPAEGRVLREVMETTAGIHGAGVHAWTLATVEDRTYPGRRSLR